VRITYELIYTRRNGRSPTTVDERDHADDHRPQVDEEDSGERFPDDILTPVALEDVEAVRLRYICQDHYAAIDVDEDQVTFLPLTDRDRAARSDSGESAIDVHIRSLQ